MGSLVSLLSSSSEFVFCCRREEENEYAEDADGEDADLIKEKRRESNDAEWGKDFNKLC